MLDTLLAKVVGTQNDRELKRLRPIVAEVNALEGAIQGLTDERLRAIASAQPGEGRVILITSARRYEEYKARLPKPSYLDTDGTFVFAEF